MAFNAVLDTNAGIGIITLSGQLDASVAPQFREEVERAAAQEIRRLVLRMEDLEYMASAGLRALIFAKQKMGPGVDLVIVGAQGPVLDTIRMTGFDHSVTLLPEYDAAHIDSA